MFPKKEDVMFGTALFYFILATLVAMLEIEVEGKYGWAEKLPTWCRTHGLAAKIYGVFMSGRPLTGYHAIMFVLVPIFFHLPFASGMEWTFEGELTTLAMYFAWCPVWDFLWFVLNPAYGVRKFRKENIWWHNKVKWIGRVPLDYIIGWVLSVLLAWWAGVLEEQLAVLGLWMVFLLIVIALAPRYQRWRVSMNGRDDRHLARIFHRD